MDDDRFRLLPGALQPVQILVVVERISARPIDQPNIGIIVAAAVEFVALAGMEQRVGETRDIARAAVWLASDHSDYVTGATLYVDGGMTLYPEFREGG